MAFKPLGVGCVGCCALFVGLFLVGLDVFVWFGWRFVCSDLSSGFCFL